MDEEIDEVIVEETPEEETRRAVFNRRMKEIIPDYDESDDERSAEMLTTYVNDGESQKERLAEALRQDPRLAQLLSDVVSGKRGAVESLVRVFGKDFLSAEEGTPEYEQIVRAETERKQEQEALENTRAEYESNLESSMPNVEAFCEEKGYSVDEFLGRAWESVIQPILSGTYTREVCEYLDKGFSYDKDTEDALKAGEVKGRNTNIQSMKQDIGDSLPKINGSETMPSQRNPPKENSIFDDARMASAKVKTN